jgi:hypothetical protein
MLPLSFRVPFEKMLLAWPDASLFALQVRPLILSPRIHLLMTSRKSHRLTTESVRSNCM